MPDAGRDTGSHQLVALKLLLTSQTTHGFIVWIDREPGGYLDGWFHTFLVKRNMEQPKLGCSTFGAMSVPREPNVLLFLAGWQGKLHGYSRLTFNAVTVRRFRLVAPLLHGINRSLRQQWIPRDHSNIADASCIQNLHVEHD